MRGLQLPGMAILLLAAGCLAPTSPLPPGAGITVMPEVPVLPETTPPTSIPLPPKASLEPKPDPAEGPLALADVLTALELHFPLIDAAEQERAIAQGLQLTAEGGFDTFAKVRGGFRDGSFNNGILDASVEQAVPFRGITTFAGYRFGLGDFPIYHGGLKTADGGEFRMGLLLPLMRDGPIDRRRALLRQTQLAVELADPAVQRVRIDAYLAARQAYFEWLAAGELYKIAENFAQVAADREEVIRERFTRGAVPELDVYQAKQTLAERQGRLLLVAQRFQEATVRLSLFYRDSTGAPLLATARQLPGKISALDPNAVPFAPLEADVQAAWQQRPELREFRFQKEQLGVEVRLAENDARPGLNLGLAAAQDLGNSSPVPPGTGAFSSDRTFAEAFLAFDVPVQRREALGRLMTANARMHQLLQRELFTRDQIAQQVQRLRVILERDRQQLAAAIAELTSAGEVVNIARNQYERGAIRLFELNNLEVIALDAEAKAVDILADFYQSLAAYRAALGLDRITDGE